jgi:hypothetical protein
MKNSKIIMAIFCIALAFVYACTVDEDTKAPETAAAVIEVIGVQENGDFHLNDQEGLRAKWEKTLLEQGYDVTLKRFDFVNTDIDGSGKSSLILMASNEDGTVKIATKITLEESDTNVRRLIGGGGGTVTCTGCTVGCSPKDHAEYGWTCTPCVTSGTCTKSESVPTIAN